MTFDRLEGSPEETGHEATSLRVVLGVAGGIAAYKACELLRHFTESGHGVRVVPTASALQFVGEPTWAALSGHPVATDVWASVHEVPHVRHGQHADLVVVAPATADLMAKAAHGLADDLLTNTLLTARCPVVFAPAMHTEMWEHPATVANVVTLRARGCTVLEPAVGRLTGADTGKGRLPSPADIFHRALDAVAADSRARLDRTRVVVTAGGTRERLDPVRYLSNSSSGLQGYALARAALARGAEVTLISANVDVEPPSGVELVEVVSTADMLAAVQEAAVAADVVVMAAAPADFRAQTRAAHKIKKVPGENQLTLNLEQTEDILATICQNRPTGLRQVVGFAAETGDEDGTVREHAEAKLRRKGCDLLVVNDVSGGGVFGETHNQVSILADRSGEITSVDVPFGTKAEIAHAIWDEVAASLAPGYDLDN